MAPHPGSEADHIRDKARRDLLNLLEGVSKAVATPESGQPELNTE